VANWLITREAEDARRECQALHAKGVHAISTPCIDCVTLPWPEWAQHPGRAVVFLTSRRSAQQFLDAGPRGELVAAVAPSTTGLLDAEHCAVDLSATGGALALANALHAWWQKLGQPKWHVRYPTSDRGATASGEQSAAIDVLSRVGPVDRRVVYQTRVPEGLARTLGAHAVEQWSISLASPSAVEAFFTHAPAQAVAPRHVVVFGHSTEAAWNSQKPASWPTATLTTTVVETIVSLEEKS
jgi:uroporphyrinogen-III synthase